MSDDVSETTKKNRYFALFYVVILPSQSSKELKISIMNKRIIYVGTLLDLARMFESDLEEEERVMNHLNEEYDEIN